MKAAFVALTAAASFVSAHYQFRDLIANGTTTTDWTYVRMTANHVDSHPQTDVTASAIRCFEDSDSVAANTSTYSVAAGATVGFKADNTMGHPGYFSAYLCKASPSANSSAACTGSSWFKIWEWSPSYSASTGLVFDSQNINQFTFTIPKSTPSGQYLLRGEQIALHLSGTSGGAQFYLGCAQLNIVSGGSGSPSPLVAFPGAYKATDPGILINIYALPSGFTGYTAPGPKVWTG
ncbi:glycoside hydrolase [Auriculariales sp. MPI-PUGE-AT-0066]|nr:glycoside hydrolase [Auriculariales sp. MPI-PUGE-AT-0066]